MDRWENYQQYDSFMTSHIVKLEEIEKIERRAEWERREKIRLAEEKRQKELEEQAAIERERLEADRRQREWEQQRAARIDSRNATVGFFIFGVISFAVFITNVSESFFSYKSLISLLASLSLIIGAWNEDIREDKHTFASLVFIVFLSGGIYGLYLLFGDVRSIYAKSGIIIAMIFLSLLVIGSFGQIFEEDRLK